MKKRLLRLTAAFMFACMVVSSVPSVNVSAEENAAVQNQEGQPGENESGSPQSDTGESAAQEQNGNNTPSVQQEGTAGQTGGGNSNAGEAGQEQNEAGSGQTENGAVQTENGSPAGPDVEPSADAAENTDNSASDANADNSAEKTEDNGAEKETQSLDDSIIEKNTGEINYIFVESPYLETPGTERIAVSYGDGTENVENITLTVEDQNGGREAWEPSVSVDNLYLFEKDYEDESATGTYEVVSVNVKDTSGEHEELLTDYEMEAFFGVNEEYDGIEELQPMNEETAEAQAEGRAALSESTPEVEATVAEIDPENPEESVNEITEALEAAEEEVDSSDKTASAEKSGNASRTASRSTGLTAASMAALGARLQTAAANTRSGDIVVALDPGHDSKHTGATGIGGLKEEVLTLKIANYCKAELETYSGVKVYMTRTSAACPYPNNSSSGGDIGDRVQAAAKAGAVMFVSIHLNSSTASGPNGAEVIVPNKNWKPDVAEEGEALAEAILKELKAVGVNMRPNEIYSRDTTIDERYPDGSKSDYFSAQIYAKEAGIPGIIVEHAFLSNSNDVNKFLKTEEGLKKLGVADATGIANYLGLSKDGSKVSVKEGTYTLVSALDSNKVATVSGSSQSNTAAAVLNDNQNISAQRFEISSAGSGYYNITAEHSGKVLDIKDGSSARGATVQQYDSNGTSAQKWCFIDAGDGYYYIRSALGTYLDVKSAEIGNGTQLDGWTFNGTAAQKWKLVESDYHPVADGTYTFSSGANSSYVMDIASGSLSNKGNVQLWKSNDTSAQRYEVTYIGDGYYKIVAEHSGKALDVTSGSKKAGANLQQYAWNNVKAQMWKFVDAGNGMYYLRSKCGTVVDFSSVASGTNINMQNMKGTSTQKWKLAQSDYRPVKDGKYVISSSKSDGFVMTEKNGNIQLESYDNISGQKFEVRYVGNGYYQILSCATGKSLDVANGSTSNKANLQTWNPNGTKSQLWKFISTSDGYFYIKSNLGTTIDLTSGKLESGTNIQMYAVAATQAQKWKLDSSRVDVNEKPFEDGTYLIQNATNTKTAMEVQGGSESNGGNIRIYNSNSTSAQRYELVYVGDGYYRIMTERSGRALDVANGSKSVGANVQQYTWNGTDAQLWKFFPAGDGTYYIKSKLGTVMDLNKSSASSGTNVEMDKLSSGNTQKWKITKNALQPVANGTYTFRLTASTKHVADITSGSTADGAQVQLWIYNATDAEHFDVSYVGDGYYKILAKHSGKALSYEAGNTGKRAKIIQSTYTGAENQLWKFIQARGGKGYYLKAKTGMVLDVASGNVSSGTKIQTWQMNGTEAQQWTLRKEENLNWVKIPNGTYTIQTGLNSSLVLDIANGSKSNRGNVQLYSKNNTEAQRFIVQYLSDGYYKIISDKSGKAVEAQSGSMVSGTNVSQYTWNNSNAQMWRFIDAGNGQYYIQSKLGTVLDVAGGNGVSKNNVQAYTLNWTTSQKWILHNTEEDLYPIMGTTTVTKDQMVKYYNSKKKVEYPYANVQEAPNIESFCQIYLEECEAEGVKAEVAFAQAMKETGFLKFGGDVKKEQYNFAGLGATGGGVSGESFSTIREGIRAQVQHLKAYASKEELKNPCVDKRFKYVKRESAKYVEWLGIKENPTGAGWATAENYGYSIVKDYITPMKKF